MTRSEHDPTCCINSALRSSWRTVVETGEWAMWGIGRDRFGVGRPTIESPKGRAVLGQNPARRPLPGPRVRPCGPSLDLVPKPLRQNDPIRSGHALAQRPLTQLKRVARTTNKHCMQSRRPGFQGLSGLFGTTGTQASWMACSGRGAKWDIDTVAVDAVGGVSNATPHQDG